MPHNTNPALTYAPADRDGNWHSLIHPWHTKNGLGEVGVHILLTQVAPGMCTCKFGEARSCSCKCITNKKFGQNYVKMVWYILMDYTNENTDFMHNVGLMDMELGS